MDYKKFLEEQKEHYKEDNLKLRILDDLEELEDFEQAEQYLNDVVNHGGISGCIDGLIYYEDTVEFYNDFEEEIENLLEDFQENCGYKNRFEAISNLNGADSVGNIKQEKNLLAWMGYEETSRFFLQKIEEID